MSLFLSARFQDQVGDASVGPKNLMPLLGMLDDVPNVTLELALLGDGSASAHCLLRIDIAVVGVRSAPTRSQLVSICALAKQMVAGSEAARLMPPTMFGVPTLDLLAAVFLYTLEKPYPLYSCITAPLNVSGKRTLPSLLQQLPYLKLFTLGLHLPLQRRALPRRRHQQERSVSSQVRLSRHSLPSRHRHRVCCAHVLQHERPSRGRVHQGHPVRVAGRSRRQDARFERV